MPLFQLEVPSKVLVYLHYQVHTRLLLWGRNTQLPNTVQCSPQMGFSPEAAWTPLFIDIGLRLRRLRALHCLVSDLFPSSLSIVRHLEHLVLNCFLHDVK
jgi:hypothetical protein